ncbi:MAG: glycerate kinase [Candidatus Omnitrophica bacterium]|nr:glycerate kinase [Candidatus Omnitrophota bacterium]
MPKILLATDKFKTTHSSAQVAESLASGLRETFPEAEIRPLSLSDGGEGFLECVAQWEDLERVPVAVPGPDLETNAGWIGLSRDGKRAYVESCQATGFSLLEPGARNPMKTSSIGVAVLLEAALACRPAEIFIGLGGSATCDAGIPVARHFGWTFSTHDGFQILGHPAEMEKIMRLEKPDSSRIPSDTVLYAVADVMNPPVGETGGVKMYAPQKGASRAEVELLERGVQHLLNLARPLKADDLSALSGGGAAGCLGLGLYIFLNARLVEGARFVSERLGLKEVIASCDAVVTGEGSFDEQSYFGKISGHIARLALEAGKKVFLVTGRKADPRWTEAFAAVFSVEEILGPDAERRPRESLAALRVHGQTLGRLWQKS